jgi:hypothetical protein
MGYRTGRPGNPGTPPSYTSARMDRRSLLGPRQVRQWFSRGMLGQNRFFSTRICRYNGSAVDSMPSGCCKKLGGDSGTQNWVLGQHKSSKIVS